MILSSKADEIVSLFQELGFERKHNKVGEDFSSNRVSDENGFHIDIVQAALPQDLTSIRMNVDNFDEVRDLLLAKGFKTTEPDARNTGTS